MKTLILMMFSLIALAARASGADEATVQRRTREAARAFRKTAFDKRHEYKRGNGVLTLAADGKARYTIVVAEKATTPERFAAKELKIYLDRITGGQFTIANTIPADGKAIVLGDCAESRKAGIDTSQLALDGYQILTRGHTLFIAGPDEENAYSKNILVFHRKPWPERVNTSYTFFAFKRGTLYGVYRFLEELGVRWFLPGPKGEVIPEARTLTFTSFSLLEEPDFSFMHMGTVGWRPDVVRRGGRINEEEYAFLEWDAAGLHNRLWLMRNRVSSYPLAFSHRPVKTEWIERFGKEHPEYFALLPDGRRDLPPAIKYRPGHLCYTSDGVFAETMADIGAFFTGKAPGTRGMSKGWWDQSWAYGDTVSMLPHDSFKPCQCQTCKPLLKETEAYWPRSTELVWQFVDRVGREVARRHPGKIVTNLAYGDYTEVPERIKKLPDNVLVGICPHRLNKVFNLLFPERYAEYMDLVRRWDAMNEMPLLFWQHHLVRSGRYAERNLGIPSHYVHSFARYIRDVSAFGRHMYMQLSTDSVVMEHLNRYVAFRMMRDTTTDVDAVLADYYQSFYGPGAGVAKELLHGIEKLSVKIIRDTTGVNSYPSFKHDKLWNGDLGEAVLKGYRAKADRLVGLTRDTPYAAAGEMMSRFFVGQIEDGRQQYLTELNAKQDAIRRAAAMVVPVRRAAGKLSIDGALDEGAWADAQVLPLVSLRDGKPTAHRTEARLLQSPETLYVAFTCFDPNPAKLSAAPGNTDSVEIFIDANNDNLSYHQIIIDTGKRSGDMYFHGPGQRADTEWVSGKRFELKRYADRWVVEIALPRKNIPGGKARWGVNFCRSMRTPPSKRDQYSTWSPSLRGGFHQPRLFGHIALTE